MKSTASIVANQRWREQEGLEPDPTVSMVGNRKHAANARPGHADAHARLPDMDADGVEVSSSYCEVSAFRYLYLIEDGWQESTPRSTTRCVRVRVGRPEATGRLVPDPDPRHRRRGRRGAVGGVGGMQVVAAAGVPRRARPARLLGAAVRPAVGGDPGDRAADLLPHRHEHPTRRPRPARPHTAEGDLRADGRAVGGRGVRHVGHGRRVRALPAVEGGVRRAGPRVGVVVALHRRRHEHAPGLRVPGDLGAAEPLLPPERVSHVHRRARRDRHAHERLGIENIMWSSDYPHPVSSWPNSRAWSRRCSRMSPPHERELVVSGNAARVWKL